MQAAAIRQRSQHNASGTVRVQYLVYATDVYSGQLNASEEAIAAALSALLNGSVEAERNTSSVEVTVVYEYAPPLNVYVAADVALSSLQHLVDQASTAIAVYMQVAADAVRSSGVVTTPPAPPAPVPPPTPHSPRTDATSGAGGAPLASAYILIAVLMLYWETILLYPRRAYLGLVVT